jgi:hypothetical protein
LAALLRTKFEEELSGYENELLEVIAPYARFLETERTKLETGLGALRRAEAASSPSNTWSQRHSPKKMSQAALDRADREVPASNFSASHTLTRLWICR